MKLIYIVLLCCLSAVAVAQPEDRFEKYFFDKVNQHRHRLRIDSLIYDVTDYIQIANKDYCGEMAYGNYGETTLLLDDQFDADPLIAPYCIAFRMCVTTNFEFEFWDAKGLEEFDIYPDNLLSKREIKRIYNFYTSDSLFLKTISVGDSISKNKTVRRISIASDYKIIKFDTIEIGRRKNKYGLEMLYVTNIFLYIKD